MENLGHRERLRQRFITSGLESFAEHEKIELLLTFAISRKDCKQIAKMLLNKFGSLAGVFDAGYEDLLQVDGVGHQSAVLIKLAKSLLQDYLKEIYLDKVKINSVRDAVNYLYLKFSGDKEESVNIILLDSKNNFISMERISSGTIDESPVYIRKVVKLAYNKNAKSIIMVHNHPSGEAEPSSADKEITKKIDEGLGLMELILYDHIIIGKDGYYSFREAREL